MKISLSILGALCFFFTPIIAGHTFNDTPTLLGAGGMPAVAKDIKGNIHLVYGLGDSLMYRYSSDQGRSFSEPQVISVIKGLFDIASRGPKITVTRSGVIVLAPTKSGNIWTYIKPGTGNWKSTGRLNDVKAVNEEGFVALGSDGNMKAFAVWYDLRTNRKNKLFGARSQDGGKTWSANTKVYNSPDSTICECCRTSLAMQGDTVHVMFRNELYGKRDLYVISSFDAGKSFGQPKKLGIGTWELNGCPMDGGDITLGTKGTVQTVWRRESKVYFCEPGKPEKPVGEGKGSTIESIAGQAAFAWTSTGDVICLLPNGTTRNVGPGHSPVLKAINDKELLCIWENEGQLYSASILL